MRTRTSTSGHTFVPLNPVRDLDTRFRLGGTTTVNPDDVAYWNDTVRTFQYYAAAVVSVTV